MVCVTAAAALALAASQVATFDPGFTDAAELNARIGLDYETVASDSELVTEARAVRLVFFAEAHDRPDGVARYLELAEALRGEPRRLWLGVEFVDRGDWDILGRYLKGSLTEASFLERVMPSSLLLHPEWGAAHLEVLRWARLHGVQVLPLENRPAGARPLVLRNSDIRVNLAVYLAQHALDRLLVLYGVQHVLGDDPIGIGLDVPALVVTAYADSALAAFVRREPVAVAAELAPVLRLRRGVYSVASPTAVREPESMALDFGPREPLLAAIESVYAGDWSEMERVVTALDDPEVAWRRAAAHALRFATQRTLGYDAEAAPAERRAARRRWMAWWERTQRRVH